ncbi:Small auxin-up RNA [Dillenia turbinata]|uniref:Small auxin-up RNA n=1 Tax=Dillenia turbinata TaxID=194707 RepID=A0AAN8ULE6_9MAGN
MKSHTLLKSIQPAASSIFLKLQSILSFQRLMGIRLHHPFQVLRRYIRPIGHAWPTKGDVPKGYFVIYVGQQETKRFMVSIFYLNQTWFKDLLSEAEEEFGFNHPMGGLTIPCTEDTFLHLISPL